MWWKSIGYGELDSDFGFVLSMHSHFNWCSSTGSHSGFKMGHQLFWLFIHSDSALILLKWRISPYFLESNIASVRVYVVLEPAEAPTPNILHPSKKVSTFECNPFRVLCCDGIEFRCVWLLAWLLLAWAVAQIVAITTTGSTVFWIHFRMIFWVFLSPSFIHRWFASPFDCSDAHIPYI